MAKELAAIERDQIRIVVLLVFNFLSVVVVVVIVVVGTYRCTITAFSILMMEKQMHLALSLLPSAAMHLLQWFRGCYGLH